MGPPPQSDFRTKEPKPDCGDSYTTLKILKTIESYILKEANFIAGEFYFNFFKKAEEV